MIRDITIGQFFPTNSWVHQLDSKTKIINTFIFIAVVLMLNNMIAYAFVSIGLFFIIKSAKVPFKFIIKGLKPIFFILILTMILNVFFTPGNTVLVKIWIVKITYEGLKLSIIMAIRLIMLVIGSSILTLTTSPIDLTDGIERLLKPLEIIKVPAHEIAMMMTIALRFIPILMEEIDKIMKAQMARGADFETGGLIKKAKSLIPLLVPLFVSAFKRADDLALAMEARCYRGGTGRTKMKIAQFTLNDGIAYVIIILSSIVLIVLTKLFFVQLI